MLYGLEFYEISGPEEALSAEQRHAVRARRSISIESPNSCGR